MSIYEEKKEQRAKLVADFNAADTEEARKGIEEAINGIDYEIDAVVKSLELDSRGAKAFAKLDSLTADAASNTPESQVAAPEKSYDLRDAGYTGDPEARLSDLVSDGPESRATVVIPSAFDADKNYGEKPFVLTESQSWINLLETVNAPYRKIDFELQSIDTVAYTAALDEGSAAPESQPADSVVYTLSTAKEMLHAKLSNELLRWNGTADSMLRQRLARAYNARLNARAGAAINGVAASSTLVAAAALKVDNLLDTFYAANYEVQGEAVWLLSPTALAQIAKDRGSDNYYYDPKSNVNVLAGRPVYQAPTIGTGAAGQTAAVLLAPKAVTLASSGAEIATDTSLGFLNDQTYYRGTFWAGAAVNTPAFVYRIVRG